MQEMKFSNEENFLERSYLLQIKFYNNHNIQ
jgi:hypothetical protein